MNDIDTERTERPPPERMSKDELYDEIVSIAGLPEKETTGSYPFRWGHLAELVRYLRQDADQTEPE